ncbi:VENN motif pre-toxin domain-containing protein [Gilliamella sp. ESL0254]|uniref:VENN motif pre-toxin domain-containing protein n=1 Tax=Gilliamella sp. ESL0254 TaxID=2705035 RepID=UPI001580C5FD|nr:VENN motif pre-toxin domain-containing protein [Gilliamella sp. ESL0254]NUF28300.1 VENN motif pre-toxin domain-containing protein [Gilliamella sp. ESL0254]
MGGDVSKGIDTATSIITGIITGDITGGLAGASAPWIAEQIKLHTGHMDKDGTWVTDNEAARLVSHAILGAVVAELQGNSGIVGGASAVGGELAAKVILDNLYGGRDIKDLTEAEKQNISALTQLVMGLSTAVSGGDAGDISTSIAASKNAVENNSAAMLAWENETRLNEQLRLLELFDGDGEKLSAYVQGEGTGQLDGVLDGAANTVSGIIDTIIHPIDTAVGMYEVVTNLDKVYDNIKISVTEWQELYEYALEHDPESAGYMIGYAKGRIGSEITGGFVLGNAASKVVQKVARLKVLSNAGKWTNIIDSNKFNYLFGNSTSNAHNAARLNQLALEMKRLGIFNDVQGQQLLENHFQLATQGTKNIVNSFSNSHGTFEVRQSLLIGPSGKATMLETTFQVMPDGSRRFVTTIPKSGAIK